MNGHANCVHVTTSSGELMLTRLTAAATALVLGAGIFVAVPASASVSTAPAVTVDAGRTRTPSTGDVLLAWVAAEGAATYRVQVASDPSFSSASIVDETTTSALAWAPTTGLWAPNTERTLFWRVLANGLDTGTAPYETFVRTQAPAPQDLLPADGAEVTYPTPMTFSWAPVRGAVSYTLSYTAAGTTVTTEIPNLVTTEYTTPAPLVPSTWDWSVRAVFVTSGRSTATFLGPAAPVRTFTTTWPTGASAPVLRSPADGTVLNDLAFTWDAVPGAAKYEIELSADEEFTNIEYTSEVSGTSFIPTRPLPSKTYYWRVRAFDTLGKVGRRSAERQVRKIMGADAASMPADQTADTTRPLVTVGSPDIGAPSDIPFDDFAISWTPVPRATYYEVIVTQLDGGAPVTCTTASTTATIIASFEATGNQTTLHDSAKACLWATQSNRSIRPGPATYKVTVQAVNMAADSTKTYRDLAATASDVVPSSVSAPRYFTVSEGERPRAARVQAADGLLTTTEVSPDLRWEPVEGAKGYRVRLFSDAGHSSQIGTFWTPTPRLRSNGVFARNTTDASADAYSAVITAADNGIAEATSWPDLPGLGEDHLDWKRSGAAPAPGSVTDEAGTSVLHLTPTPADALGGTNRGYQVRIASADDSSAVAAVLKVDQPFTAAVETVTYTTGRVALKALPPGRYQFSYAVLDAAGKPGPFSEATGFGVGQSTADSLEATPLPNGSSVRLSWKPLVTAASYQVNLRAVGESWKALSTTPYRQPQTTFAGVVPGKTYEWNVVTIDKDNNKSAQTATETFTLPVSTLAVPSVPNTLRPDQLALSWTPVPGASRYLVRVAETGRLASTTPVETASTTYVPTVPLTYGKSYVWDVRAVPEKAESASSASRAVMASAGQQSFTVQTLPAQVKSARAVINGREATVTWAQLAGDAVGAPGTIAYTAAYRPKPATATDAGWRTLPPVVDGASATLAGLALGTRYEFRVAATNAVGRGLWSTTVEATTATAPGVVRSLSASGNLNGLRVTWQSPASNGGATISGYTVAYRLGAGAWTTLSTTSSSLTLAKLRGGQRYEVRVSAVNMVGTGPVASASAVTLTLPSAVRSVTASRADRAATVRWAPPATTGGSAVTAYTVEVRSLVSGTWSPWSPRSTASSSARSVTLSSLTNGTTYQVRVMARTSLGAGAPSSAASVVPAGKPLAPTVTAKRTSKKKTIKVAWKAAGANGTKVTSYVVQYSTNGKKWKTLRTVAPTSKNYTWKKARSGRTYHFRVYAKNAIGSGAKSRTVTAKAR